MVLASDQWHPGVIGIVASRMVNKFNRPAVMIALNNGHGQGSGRSIPCKAQFLPVEETPPLNLGPKQRANGCLNLFFSPTGKFEMALPPGKYYIIVSHGPEYDAAYRSIALREGETVQVSATLPRVVNSAGWISAVAVCIFVGTVSLLVRSRWFGEAHSPARVAIRVDCREPSRCARAEALGAGWTATGRATSRPSRPSIPDRRKPDETRSPRVADG